MPILPIKITQITKDFDLKSKDVLDTFKELGIEKKTGGSADADEFELFLSHLTLKNQIKDLDAYRSGRTKIRSSVEKKEKPAPAPKAEEKPQQKPAPKAEEKPAQKPEQKPAPKVEEKKPQPQQQRPQRDDRRGDDRRRPERDSYNKYSAAPQANPFAKKLDNMQRAAQGLRNPNSQWQKPQQKPEVKPAAPVAPVAPKSELRPAQQAQLEKQQKLEAQKAQQKPAQPQPQKPKKEEKKA